MAIVDVPPCSARQQQTKITTSLYDLIEAVQQTVGPENDDLVVAIVMDLVHSGRIRLLRHTEVNHCN